MSSQRDEILHELAKSAWLHEACRNIGGSLCDDLKQELFIQLCSKKPQEIEQVYAGGYMRWYCIRLLVRTFHGNGKQKFHREYRRKNEPLPDIEGIYEEYSEDEIQAMQQAMSLTATDFEKIGKDVNRSGWYVRLLWQEFCSEGSARKVSIKTKIAIREVTQVIRKVKNIINDRYIQISG